MVGMPPVMEQKPFKTVQPQIIRDFHYFSQIHPSHDPHEAERVSSVAQFLKQKQKVSPVWWRQDTACSCRKPEVITHTLRHIGSSFYCAWGTSIPQGLADLHSIWTKKREGWKGDAIKFRSHNHCKDFLLYILNTGICFFQFSTHRF